MFFNDILTASSFRSNLFNIIKDVIGGSKALKITSKAGNVVIIPEDEYSSMKETFHLMSSPANAIRINQGISDLESGNTITKTLEELDGLE